METQQPTSLLSKLLVCLLAGVTAGASLARVGHRFLSAFLPLPVIYGASLLLLVVATLAAGRWHYREKKRGPQLTTLAYWQGVLRYAIALDLSMFGWQKIFHLQFITPLAMLDEPFSSLSGEWLTWSYFGHSYPFVVVVALLQIGGSWLLLFSRTRLLAIFVLMPVMINIVLIDFFYGLETIVLVHACIHTTALLYLLLYERRRLWTFFLATRAALPATIQHPLWRNILRISAIAIPLILLAAYNFPDHHPRLTGKYAVHNVRINGNPTRPTTCQDSVLTYVYLDIADECVFTFNSLDHRAFGHYTFNEATDSLHITWRYPDPQRPHLRGTLIRQSDSLQLSGIVGRNHIKASLLRVQ
jgi:hypothetical protein